MNPLFDLYCQSCSRSLAKKVRSEYGRVYFAEVSIHVSGFDRKRTGLFLTDFDHNSIFESCKSTPLPFCYNIKNNNFLLQYNDARMILGFTEIKKACCGLGKLNADVPCIPLSSYCLNRRSHVFWDLYHPTEAVSSMFTDILYSGSQQYMIPMNVK